MNGNGSLRRGLLPDLGAWFPDHDALLYRLDSHQLPLRTAELDSPNVLGNTKIKDKEKMARPFHVEVERGRGPIGLCSQAFPE